jgi:hypothetical protein
MSRSYVLVLVLYLDLNGARDEKKEIGQGKSKNKTRQDRTSKATPSHATPRHATPRQDKTRQDRAGQDKTQDNLAGRVFHIDKEE